MTCAVCGTELPDGEWASCQIEGRCLEHCSDFANHCGTAELYDEWTRGMPDEDADYERVVDQALGDAIEHDDMENWQAYLPKGGA